jgi:RNA 2',3'-cyclic 3'-phosphodiesterase
VDRSLEAPQASADRLFLGIALPDELQSKLDDHLRRALEPDTLPGRVVPPANWHLTLRFLGDTPPAQAEQLRRHLRGADLGPGFAIRFGTCGAFPRAARASVLWLGIQQGAEPLGHLASVVEHAARQAGFRAENHPFRAHLTLSRLQPPRDLRPLLQTLPAFPEPMQVHTLTLFRSHLGRGPARYEAVEEFGLG